MPKANAVSSMDVEASAYSGYKKEVSGLLNEQEVCWMSRDYEKCESGCSGDNCEQRSHLDSFRFDGIGEPSAIRNEIV